MDTAKLEKTAQRYRDAVAELDDARTDLQHEAVAAIRQEGKRGDQAEVARITGWTREQIRQLAIAMPYFTTETSEFFHATPDCAGWRRGRAAGDGKRPILPLSKDEAAAAVQAPCPECVASAAAGPGSGR